METKPKERPKSTTKFSRSQVLTINGLLCAIILSFMILPIYVVGMVETAIIPLIAIVISAEFLGFKNSIVTGLFFGVVSMITAFIHPDILSRVFYNPLISIVPRMLIGASAHLAMKGIQGLFPKLNKVFSYAVGAAAGVITNTVFVLGMILAFFYGSEFVSGTETVYIGWEWISVIIAANFLVELAVVTFVTPPIIIALNKTIKFKYN